MSQLFVRRFFKGSNLLLLIIFLTLVSQVTHARTWYVMYGGTGGPTGPANAADAKWANAGWGIRQSIEAAQDGDEVWVAGGNATGDPAIKYIEDHYRMDYTMVLRKNIKIYGGFPRPNVIPGVAEPQKKHRDMVKYATIFDGTSMSEPRQLFSQDATCTNALFDGFYVVSGRSTKGAGIKMGDGLIISHCVFVDNISTGTLSTEGGAAVYMTGGTLINCIIANNEAVYQGGAVYLSGNARMINCTVVNNSVTGGGGNGRAAILSGSTCYLDNTVFWNNGGIGDDVVFANGALVSQVRNCAYSNSLAGSPASNIKISDQNVTGTKPPFFNNTVNIWQGTHFDSYGALYVFNFANLGDWYLQHALTSLFDKGDNSLLPSWAVEDVVNKPRIRNGIVDIGCYEVQPIAIRNAVIATKVYDGNATGSMSSFGNFYPTSPSNVTISSVGVVYADKNAAPSKNVRLTYTLTGPEASKFFVEPMDTLHKIDPKAIAISADATSKIYGVADPVLSYSGYDIRLLGDSWSGNLIRTTGENVGIYGISQGSLSAGSNYALSFTGSNFEIKKKDLTVSGFKLLDRAYSAGDKSAEIENSGSLVGVVAGDDVSLFTTNIKGLYSDDLMGVNKPVVAWTPSMPYLIGAKNDNYNLLFPSQSGAVGVASTVISIVTPSLVYDGSVKSFSASHTPSNAADVTTFTFYQQGTSIEVSPKNVGVYDVKCVVSGSFYNSTKIETFTILPKPLTITADLQSKTYGTVDPTLTYTNSGLAIGSSFIGALNRAVGESVGDYAIGSGSLSVSDASNYSIVFLSKNLSIGKKSITVSVNSGQSKVYGTVNPVYSYTSNPIESALPFSDKFSGALSREVGENVTSYIVLQNTLSLKNSAGTLDVSANYAIAFENTNKFQITPKAITITPITPLSKTYGDADPVLKYSCSVSPLPNGDVFTGNVTRGAGETAGVYLYDLGTLKAGASNTNYTISLTPTNFVVNKRVVNINTISAQSKLYDGLTAATLTAVSVANKVVLDDVGYNVVSANFSDKNVGVSKSVTATFELSGSSKDNYTLSLPSGLNASITAKELSADGFSIASKAADGNNVATVSYWGSLVPLAPTDANDVSKVRIDVAGVVATFNDASAATNKPITLSILKLIGTEAGNYTLKQPSGLTASIGSSAASFVWANGKNETFTYDGTQKHSTVDIVPSGKSFTVTYTLNGVSTTTQPTNAGVYSVTVTSLDGSFVGGDNGSLTIQKKMASLSFANISKEYDRTDNVASMPALTITGLVASDNTPTLKVVATGGVAKYSSVNAGSRTVTISGVSLSGSSSGNYTIPTSVVNTNCSISKRGTSVYAKPEVTFEPITKIFDGTGAATYVPAFSISNILSGDVLSVTASLSKITYLDPSAGVGNKIVVANVLDFSDAGVAANYVLPTSCDNKVSSITKKDIGTISLTFPNQSKFYNGNDKLQTMPKSSDFVLSGLEVGYTSVAVDTTSAVALFDSKNVGTRTVTISGIKFGGNDIANYNLPTTASNKTSEIKKLGILPSSIVFDPISKVYDGNLSVPFNPILRVIGLIGATDKVYATTTIDKVLFDGDGAGSHSVTASGIQFSGDDAGNYSIPSSATISSCTITKLSLGTSLQALSFANQSKYYDGSVALPTMPVIQIIGLIGSDDVEAVTSGSIGSYSDKNVGLLKRVTISGISYTGADADNYIIPTTAYNDASEIMLDKRPKLGKLISFDAYSKTYDGTTGAVANNMRVENVYGNDVIVIGYTSANFDDENVGNNKSVKVKGITFSGLDAGNYFLPDTAVQLGNSITQLDITKNGINVSFNNQTKEFDGTVSVKGPFVFTLSGLVAIDAQNSAYVVASASKDSAIYDNPSVDEAKTVTIKKVNYSGLHAGNYILPKLVQNFTSSITPIDYSNLGVIDFDATVKVYDGTNKIVNMPALSVNLPIAGDVKAIAVSGSFDTKNVGDNKGVFITSIIYSGNDVDNYKLPKSAANNKGKISPIVFPPDGTPCLSFAPQSKVYDASIALDSIPRLLVSSLIAGDEVFATGKTGHFDNKNVGAGNKRAVVKGVIFSGVDARNYSIADSAVNSSCTITPKVLTSGDNIVFAPVKKVYDGDRSVLSVPDLFLVGVEPFDDVKASGTLALFANKNVGTSKLVTVYGVKTSGLDKANYVFSDSAFTRKNSISLDSALMVPRVTFDAITKVYDGKFSIANVPTLTLSNIIEGDDLHAVGKIAVFNSKDAGDKVVTVRGVSYTGTDVANYLLADSCQNKSCRISPMPVEVAPLPGQSRIFSERDTVLSFSTNPSALPNGEQLNGRLERSIGTAVGSYLITQGTLNNSLNPNYEISVIPNIPFVISSNVEVFRKWGYVLVVNNDQNLYKGYQWYENGKAITGATNQMYYNKEKMLCGIYKVEVLMASTNELVFSENRVETDCQSLKSYVVYPTVLSKSQLITIENSAHNTTIAFRGADTDQAISPITIGLYSMLGVLVDSYVVDSIEKFTFSAPLVSGTYILKVAQNGLEVLTEKIVIQ